MEKEIETVVNKLGLTKDDCSFDEYYAGDYRFKITPSDPFKFPRVFVKKHDLIVRISFGLLKNLKKDSIFDFLDSVFKK